MELCQDRWADGGLCQRGAIRVLNSGNRHNNYLHSCLWNGLLPIALDCRQTSSRSICASWNNHYPPQHLVSVHVGSGSPSDGISNPALAKGARWTSEERSASSSVWNKAKSGNPEQKRSREDSLFSLHWSLTELRPWSTVLAVFRLGVCNNLPAIFAVCSCRQIPTMHVEFGGLCHWKWSWSQICLKMVLNFIFSLLFLHGFITPVLTMPLPFTLLW